MSTAADYTKPLVPEPKGNGDDKQHAPIFQMDNSI